MPLKRSPRVAVSSTQALGHRVRHPGRFQPGRYAADQAGVPVVGRPGRHPGGVHDAADHGHPDVDPLDVGLELHGTPADVVQASQGGGVELLDDRADAADHLVRIFHYEVLVAEHGRRLKPARTP